MADSQSTQDTQPGTSQDGVLDRKRKRKHSTEPEAKLRKQTSNSKVLRRNPLLATHMQDVEEVCDRLLTRDVLTPETSQTIKDCLPKQDGQTLAAKTLHQCLADDTRQSSFFLFIDVLEDLKQVYLANQYRIAYLKDLKVELQENYKANYCKVYRKPWIEDDTIDIDDIFINLELLQREEFRKSVKPKQYKHYRDIFNDPDYGRYPRGIVCGVAGSGKSTLSHKIVFDWANGEILNFFLVLLVHVREITAEQGLYQKLKGMYPDVYFEELFKLEKGSVLLILDGFDELQENVDSSEVIEILKGKEFHNFNMLLTTRPHGLKLLKSFDPLKLNIKGFSQKDVVKYIKRYFKKANPTKATKVIKKCANTNNLWSLMENPLCCLLVCFLYENRYANKHVDYEMPDKKTELYSQVLEVFQDIYNKKHGDKSSEGMLLNMGELAFDKLLSKENGVLIFAKETLAKYNIESAYACNLGILSRIESFKGNKTCESKTAVSVSKTPFYNFIHKSMQEFTAAMYVHNAEPTATQNILQILLGSIKSGVASLELFLHFVCGLDKGSGKGCSVFLTEIFDKCCDLLNKTTTKKAKLNIVDILVNLCLESKPDILKYLRRNMRLMFVKKAYEAGYHDSAQKNYTRFARVLGALNTPDVQTDMVEVIKLNPVNFFVNNRVLLSEEELSRIACFMNTDAISLEGYHLESFFAKVLTCCDHLRTIALVKCDFIDTHTVGELFMCVSHWPKLVSFTLHGPRFPRKKSLKKFSEFCPVPSPVSISQLQSLNVCDCDNADIFIYLTQLLECLTGLSKLVLSANKFGDTLEELVNALPLSLEKLDLGNCKMSSKCVTTVLKRVSHLHNLKNFNLANNSLKQTTWNPSSSAIKELNLHGCDLDEACVKEILNKPLSLEKLDLSDCKMSDKCVTTVLKQVANLHSLTNLNLEKNSLSQANLILIPVAITELNLYCCGLTKECGEEILKKLPTMNRLTHLNIGGNNFGCVDSNLLGLFPISLLMLSMSSCYLTAESVKTLFKNLTKWTQLRKLELSSNTLSVLEWREVCGVLEELKECNLRNHVVVDARNTGISVNVKKDFAKVTKNIKWLLLHL